MGAMETKIWRRQQRAQGLCIECTQPAALTLRGNVGVFCDLHREKQRSRRGFIRGYRAQPKISLDAFIHLPPQDLAYAACLIDGEGYAGFTESAAYFFSPVLCVGMTDREPVEFCAGLFGSNVTIAHTQSGQEVFTWRCGASRAAAVAKAILPYLKIARKREAAYFMLRMYDVLGVCRYRWERDETAIAQRVALDNEIKAWHKKIRGSRSQARSRYYVERENKL
jgi:hypothetical protein